MKLSNLEINPNGRWCEAGIELCR